MIVVGEGVELLVEPVPDHLVGKALAASQIGAQTGLNVIGIRTNGELVTNPAASAELEDGSELVMIGTAEQRQRFLSLESDEA